MTFTDHGCLTNCIVCTLQNIHSQLTTTLSCNMYEGMYLPCWPRPKLPPGVYVTRHISFPLKIIVKNFKLSTSHIVTTCKYHWMSRYSICSHCRFAGQLYMHNHFIPIPLLFWYFKIFRDFTNQIFYLYLSFQWTSLRFSLKTRIFIHCSLSSPVRTFYIISCYMEYYTDCHHFRNFTPETTLLPSKSWDC